MATAKSIDNKIISYLSYLSATQKEALLNIARSFNKDKKSALEESMLTKEQLQELDKRWLAYKNGEGINYSWDETKARILKKIKALKK